MSSSGQPPASLDNPPSVVVERQDPFEENPAPEAPSRTGSRAEHTSEVVADAGRRIVVRVIDESEAPLPNATVTIRRRVGGEVVAVDPSIMDVPTTYLQSDEDGTVVSGELEPDRYEVLAWRHDMFFNGNTLDLTTEEVAEIVLSLRPAAYVDGRAFINDHSTPLRDAVMDLLAYNRPRAEPIVKTDSEGRFVVGPFINPRQFFHLGYQHFRVVTIPVDIKGERPQKTDIVFVKGVAATGYVTDSAGTPIPGIPLGWHRENTESRYRLKSTTDTAGRYELRGLHPSRYYVTIEGFAHHSRPPHEITLEDSPPHEVNLEVDCIPAFEVLVEGPGGEPVVGVEVKASCSLPEQSGSMELITDRDGIASLLCVPAGITVDLSVNDGRFGFGHLICDSSNHERPVRIRLQPFVRLEGTVVNTDDGAVEGARITTSR